MKLTTRTLAIFFVLFLLVSSRVNSQSSTPSALPSTAPVTFNQLQNDYRFQVEKYREAEEKFNFEKTEFHKLGTLASQEDALSAMKQLMTARAKTQAAYISLLQHLLLDSASLFSDIKSPTLDKLTLALAFLHNHDQEVPHLFEKENIIYASADFEEDIYQVHEAEYRALSLIAINRLQSSHHQLSQAVTQFESISLAGITDPSFKAATERGLKEVSQLLQESFQAIATALDTYHQYDQLKSGNLTKTSFAHIHEQIIKDLIPAHSSLQTAINFLIELDKGTSS